MKKAVSVEMAQQLKAYTALIDEQNSIPRTHSIWLTSAYKSSSRRILCLCSPPVPALTCTYLDKHRHIIKNEIARENDEILRERGIMPGMPEQLSPPREHHQGAGRRV